MNMDLDPDPYLDTHSDKMLIQDPHKWIRIRNSNKHFCIQEQREMVQLTYSCWKGSLVEERYHCPSVRGNNNLISVEYLKTLSYANYAFYWRWSPVAHPHHRYQHARNWRLSRTRKKNHPRMKLLHAPSVGSKFF